MNTRHKEAGDLLTPGEVNREAEGRVSPATVRHWGDTGVLPVIRTATGRRLFRRDDVKRVLAERRRTAKR